jgi:hypothetical protein
MCTAITVMPMEKRSKKLSVAWAVMLILWEIKATITFKMIRLVTTPSASLADPLLVEIIANAFFIIEFSVITKKSTESSVLWSTHATAIQPDLLQEIKGCCSTALIVTNIIMFC